MAAHPDDTLVSLRAYRGGTLNHFARDVGVGRDVPAAVQPVAAGDVVSIDAATVNDRLFLNNSSIGLYLEMVHLREIEEQQLGKRRALLRAGLLALQRTMWTTGRVASGEYVDEVRTRLLFVGDNPYEFRLMHLGRRESLQERVLDAPTRLQMVRTVLPSLAGRFCLRQPAAAVLPGGVTVGLHGPVHDEDPPSFQGRFDACRTGGWRTSTRIRKCTGARGIRYI